MNWTDLAAFATIVALCITAATVYLRLFVSNQLAEHETNMHRWLDDNYHSRAVINLLIQDLKDRVGRLESFQDG